MVAGAQQVEGFERGPEHALRGSTAGDRDRPARSIELEGEEGSLVQPREPGGAHLEVEQLLAGDRGRRATVGGEGDRTRGRPEGGAQRQPERRVGVRVVEPVAPAELEPVGLREGGPERGVHGQGRGRDDHARVPGVADDEEREKLGVLERGAGRGRFGAGAEQKGEERPTSWPRTRLATLVSGAASGPRGVVQAVQVSCAERCPGSSAEGPERSSGSGRVRSPPLDGADAE